MKWLETRKELRPRGFFSLFSLHKVLGKISKLKWIYSALFVTMFGGIINSIMLNLFVLFWMFGRFCIKLGQHSLPGRREMWTFASSSWKIFCGCTKKTKLIWLRPFTRTYVNQSPKLSSWRLKSLNRMFRPWFRTVKNGPNLNRYLKNHNNKWMVAVLKNKTMNISASALLSLI